MKNSTTVTVASPIGAAPTRLVPGLRGHLGSILVRLLGVAGPLGADFLAASAASAEDTAVLQRHGGLEIRLHDPSSVVECDGEYWLFATGQGLRSWRSRDLAQWEPGPRVFPEIPSWVTEIAPTQRGHFWAPDVVCLGGRYLLYYSVSSFGKNSSAIALASNPTLNPADPRYGWTDHGVVIRSTSSDDFNAIDPAVSIEPDGLLWMAFGSFWSGIKLVELDPVTGLRLNEDSHLHALAKDPSSDRDTPARSRRRVDFGLAAIFTTGRIADARGWRYGQ